MSLAENQPALKLRVAIVGGGMGGLVLALALKKYAPDVRFDIYESAPQLTEVGAGIGMSPRIWSIVKDLGLEDDLVTIQGTEDRDGSSFWIRKGDEEPAVDIVELPNLHAFHRSVLQKLLAKHLDAGDRIHFAKRLTSYSEPPSSSPTDPITLNFGDGTTATCDFVVGSDGIRSAVRRTMYNGFAQEAEERSEAEEAARLRGMVEPVFTGQVAYRGLAPAGALSPELVEYIRTPQVLVGKNGQMALYPVSGGKFINVAAIKRVPGPATVYEGPWVEPTNAETVARLFENWEPRALAIAKAHAMLPHQGAGVGQAFEDGLVLATILSQPAVTLANLPAALAIYDDVRRPYSQGVQEGSARNGDNYHLHRAGWEAVSAEDSSAGRYARGLVGALEAALRAQTRWLFETGVLDGREALRERVAALAA